MPDTLTQINNLADAGAESAPEPETPPTTGQTTEEVPLTGEAEEEKEETPEETFEDPLDAEVPEDAEEQLEGATTLDVKAIKAKYPEIFKEFPELRKATYLSHEFQKLFPSVEDAKDASQRLKGMDNLEGLLASGNVGVFLDELVQWNRPAGNKFIQEFLPTVQQRSPAAYTAMIEPVLAKVLIALDKHGEATNNQNQRAAARIVNHFLNGKMELPDVPKPREISPQERALQAREQAFAQTQIANFRDSVHGTIERDLDARISKRIDPSVPESQKKYLIETIRTELLQTLDKDEVHMNRMRAHWERAPKNGLTEEDKGRIISAFLARATKVLPQVSQKHIREFVTTSQTPKPERKYIPGSTAPSGSKRVDLSKVDWSRSSTFDVLNGTAALKKG